MSPAQIDEIESKLDAFNSAVTGRDDAASIGFVIRDEAGAMLAAIAGYSWAGIAESSSCGSIASIAPEVGDARFSAHSSPRRARGACAASGSPLSIFRRLSSMRGRLRPHRRAWRMA